MLLQQNAPMLSTALNSINDSQPGSSFVSPTGGQPFAGIVGQTYQLSNANAQRQSTSLWGGIYMYVQFLSTSTASNARGQIVFFDTLAHAKTYVVTPDPPTALTQVAGVTLNAVTKGNWGWIQIAGLATVLCKASVTDTTLGDIGFVVSDSSLGKVDANVSSSATAAQQALKLGIFMEAPANGGLKLLWLQPSLLYNCY